MRVFTRWDEVSTSSETDELLLQLAQVHIDRIHDETVAAALSDVVFDKDWARVCSYEPDYNALSVNDAINVRQVLAFYSKRSDLRIEGLDRREVAVRSFIASEDLCRETNDIFRRYREGGFRFPPHVECKLFYAQRKIANILGAVPSLSDLSVRFGPGATTQVKRRNASARRKLSVGFACSEDMAQVAGQALSELPSWVFTPDECTLGHANYIDAKKVAVQLHDGNLVFVPKTAKTDRAVVVEPSLNTLFQAGIGDYMANRLRRFGIDIRDQSRNQRLAREGSVTGGLATLDLSSASDTIARELVYDLLPVDWYLLLTSLRTSHAQYFGHRIALEKFSSMGNGFTFPLETLIFYALACSCVEDQDVASVSVYGDDIIVPTYAYDDLCLLLHCCGFIPNRAKSFSAGPFRESCGHDYFRGINIRPCYVKGPLACFDLFRLHNFYVRAFDQEPAAILRYYLDPSIIIYGPDGYGDGHLLGDHTLRPHGRDAGWSGYTFETYSFRPRKEMASLPGDRVYPLYSTYVSSNRGPIPNSIVLSDYVDFWKTREGPSNIHRYTKGRLVTTLPGVKSYNRIKIYVLA